LTISSKSVMVSTAGLAAAAARSGAATPAEEVAAGEAVPITAAEAAEETVDVACEATGPRLLTSAAAADVLLTFGAATSSTSMSSSPCWLSSTTLPERRAASSAEPGATASLAARESQALAASGLALVKTSFANSLVISITTSSSSDPMTSRAGRRLFRAADRAAALVASGVSAWPGSTELMPVHRFTRLQRSSPSSSESPPWSETSSSAAASSSASIFFASSSALALAAATSLPDIASFAAWPFTAGTKPLGPMA